MTDSQTPITLGLIWDAIRHQKVRFVLTFILIIGLVLTGLLFMPKEYGSEGKLFVQIGRHNVGLDPTTTTSGTLSVNDSRETEIRSVTELLRSSEVLGRAVDKVGSERILESKFDLMGWLSLSLLSTGADDNENGMSALEIEAQQEREKAIRKIGESLKVESEKKTSVISVYCKANTPFLAREIVTSILESYRELHVSINTVNSKGFFEEQFNKEQERLNTAIVTLRDFRNDRKFLSVEGARNTLQQVIDKLETQQVDVSVDLIQAHEKISELQKEFAEIDERIDRPTNGIERSSVEGASSEVLRLESELAKLMTSKTESHPRVVEAKSQLERLKSQIEGRPEDRTVTVNDYNPVFQQLEISLIEARTSAKALEARLTEIGEKLTTAQTDLIKLNNDEVTSKQLEREIQIVGNYVDTFARKRGEATVLDRLDEQKISNVVVAQPASLMLKHVSPRGSIVLPMGVIFATLGATVYSFLVHRKRREIVVDEDDDLELELDIPILITLPRVPTTRIAVR